MSLPSMRRRFTEQAVEYIPNATNATLDDLLSAAQRLGCVEMGGVFHPNGAELKLKDSFVYGDYVRIRSRNFPTIKENLAECIHRAELLIAFYKSI